jgi:hypothetical protein
MIWVIKNTLFGNSDFSCKWSENEEASSHPQPGADGNAWNKLNKPHLYCLQNSN